jgi:hypothetical protein
MIVNKLLKENGWMVVKVFQGIEHEAFILDMKAMFERIEIVKPKASRKRSAEVYIVAKNLRKDRILPSEFRENKRLSPYWKKNDEDPIPGDQLPDYGESKEYHARKRS